MRKRINLITKKLERIKEVEHDINTTGFYHHTSEELIYGARLAWRNSNRCIGRLFWESLKVQDARHIKDEPAFLNAITTHIEKLRIMVRSYHILQFSPLI